MALDAETRQQLIETVRRFVTERLRPLEAKVSDEDRIPNAVLEEMKALGLFGLSIPSEYGGLDLSMEDECLVMMEMGRTSPATTTRRPATCRRSPPARRSSPSP
jgi:acyl-CoA dehydrogenase